MRGLLIGRFQPFHQGHLAVVEQIRAARLDEEMILGVGSAQASYTSENPFTAGERIEMIEAALDEAHVRHVRVYPIVDVDRHAVWVAHVKSLVPPFERVYTNNPLTRLLFEHSGYGVEQPPWVERERFEGRRIRSEMLSGDGWRASVPPAVARCIDACAGVQRLRLLTELDHQRASPRPK